MTLETTKQRAASLEAKPRPKLERKSMEPEPEPYFPPPPKVDGETATDEVEGDFDDPVVEAIKELLGPIDGRLRSETRRKVIEDRCQPLDLASFFSTNELRQKVPIIPNIFEPVFRTVTVGEDLQIQQIISREEGTKEYLAAKLSLYAVVLAVVSDGSKRFTSHLVDGKFNEDAFFRKYDELRALGYEKFADLQINKRWFSLRVVEEINAASLKKS